MKECILRYIGIVTVNHKRILIEGGGSLLIVILVVQLLYPDGQMLPFARVENIAMGSWQKSDAVWELDKRYLSKKVAIYFGENDQPYRTPTIGELGLVVSNRDRIEDTTYHWWLRIVPSSIIWGHLLDDDQEPSYSLNKVALDGYVKNELGQSCNVLPKDASITVKGDVMNVVSSSIGGTCKVEDIDSALKNVKPLLTKNTFVKIPVQEIQPNVTSSDATKLRDSINTRLGKAISVNAGREKVTIPSGIVKTWLDFSVVHTTLTPSLSNERSSQYLSDLLTPKVSVPSGVSKVSTLDFIETSRQNGANGQTLALNQTLTAILEYVTSKSDSITAMTQATLPRVEYARSYSTTDSGMNALIANYAKDHPGTFGISFQELSGERRRANYNETKTFTTASTYKLFVAYSVLKRVDSGVWNWGDIDISNGQNLSSCFDDMIVKSDNACAESLLKKIGYKKITDEVKALGLTNTTFMTGNFPQSTASDESLFLAQLETNQLQLTNESRATFIGALKRNIFRQGIPSGADAVVADKVGFLNGLLHDSAIVYSASGTYVLVIMTDGSSWNAIADLTRQIQTLRAS